LESKRDPALENEIVEWIKAKTGEDASPLEQKLNDGLILCKLVNAIKPGIVKAGPAKMAFHKMENINRFTEAAQKLGEDFFFFLFFFVFFLFFLNDVSAGVKELDVFATVDLYEGKNMVKVIDTLATLKRITE
jgi:hypothetical protein